MTREEAIKLIQNVVACADADGCTLSCESCEFYVTNEQVLTAHEMAISALRQQECVGDANKALTLDELRKMDGEPVWTATIGLYGSGRWELCACETICACPLHKVLRCVTATGECTDYEFDTYGKTWLAYRRKPEEGTVCT